MLAFASAGQAAPRHAQTREAQATAPAQPALLGQFGDWGAYTATAAAARSASRSPNPSSAETEPANRPRDPAFLFISTRPAENVRNEVSIIIGYPFKPSSDATVEIGGAKFAMYTQANDGAWIKNAAEEARMVDAMRKSGDLVVRASRPRAPSRSTATRSKAWPRRSTASRRSASSGLPPILRDAPAATRQDEVVVSRLRWVRPDDRVHLTVRRRRRVSTHGGRASSPHPAFPSVVRPARTPELILAL